MSRALTGPFLPLPTHLLATPPPTLPSPPASQLVRALVAVYGPMAPRISERQQRELAELRGSRAQVRVCVCVCVCVFWGGRVCVGGGGVRVCEGVGGCGRVWEGVGGRRVATRQVPAAVAPFAGTRHAPCCSYMLPRMVVVMAVEGRVPGGRGQVPGR